MFDYGGESAAWWGERKQERSRRSKAARVYYEHEKYVVKDETKALYTTIVLYERIWSIRKQGSVTE